MKSLLGILLSMCVTTVSVNAHAQDALDKIKSAGVIKIGVNTDYRPFGMRQPNGEIVGIEPDMTREIGKKLGVTVELVPVQPANRIQFLQQGRIDVVLASMTYNEERAKVVSFIRPFYYAGGTGIIARKGMGIKNWTDLRGKDICGVQGTYYNRLVTEKFGVNMVAFADVTQAVNALMNQSCVGFVEDSTLTALILAGDKKLQAEYEAPLPADDVQPWGLAVSKENGDSKFAKALSDLIASWHKSGELIRLEKKWGLSASDWLQSENKKAK